MLSVVAGVGLVAHGVVHWLYAGQSLRLLALQPGLTWPDGSWAFSRLVGDHATRTLASVVCLACGAGFAAGGVALLAGLGWWRPVVATTSVCAAVVFVLLWDGLARRLDAQGAIGVVIDVAIVAAMVVLR